MSVSLRPDSSITETLIFVLFCSKKIGDTAQLVENLLSVPKIQSLALHGGCVYLVSIF